MISDRSYMREPNPAKGLAPLLWLIGALVGGFILQRILDSAAPGATSDWLALTAESVRHGRVWTLLTYSFLHEPNNLLHLILNALSILFIGRLLLPTVGTRRFLLTYFGAVLAGGIFWLAVNFTNPGRPILLGASAGTYGLLALFCCRFAFERMTVLLFFVIPVTIVPRYFLIVIGAIETIFFLFAELFPVGAQSTFAHSAHVAGMIAGIIAYRAMVERESSSEEAHPSRAAIELPTWRRKKKTAATEAPSFKINLTGRENLKAEVDRILDKINTSGFGSLTTEEKRTLDEARDMMTKH